MSETGGANRWQGKGETVLVLGCGYLGEAVAAEALARGSAVCALTWNGPRAQRLRAMGVEVVEEDLASDAWHAKAGFSCRYVLNCVGSGGGGLDGYRHSYLGGQQSLVRWTSQARPQSVVYTGSTSVYGQTGGEWVDETSATEGGERVAVLLEAEKTLLEAGADGTRRWVLRLAGIYGPGRHSWLDRLRAGGETMPGDGEGFLNLIHVSDIVRAVFAAWGTQGPPLGVFNVSDGNPARRKEIARWLCERLGRAVPRFDPASDPRVPTHAERSRRPNRRVRSEKLRLTTGWQPEFPDFRAGYENLLRNWSAEGF